MSDPTLLDTNSPQNRESSGSAGNPALLNRRDLQWKLVQAHYGVSAGSFMWGVAALCNAERQIRAVLSGGLVRGKTLAALAELDAFDCKHKTEPAA